MDIFDFFPDFLDFFKNLLRLLLNNTEVTTEHQKGPNKSTNSIKSYFFAQRAKRALAKGPSPTQELKVSPHSRLYLLVLYNYTSSNKGHQRIMVDLSKEGDMSALGWESQV